MSASDHYSRSVLQRMMAQLTEEAYEDVVVEVKDKNFRCHRFILSACSMFFRALFRSGMSEALQQMVELKDMEPETFQLILNCIYGGKNVLTRDNVLAIWQAATLLQIDFLEESCEVFLMENTDKENCIDVYICAKHMSNNQVFNLTWDIILKEFECLVKTKDIFFLDASDMERLVVSDDLRVKSEDTVVNVIKEWTRLYEPANAESKNTDVTDESQPEENPETKAYVTLKKGKKAKNIQAKNTHHSRSASRQTGTGEQSNILATLFGASRLCLASSYCLQELLTDPKVIYNIAALSHVRNALRFHLQPERRYDFCPSAAVHRSDSDWTNVMVSITSPGLQNSQPQLVCKQSPQNDWQTLLTGNSSNHVIQEQCNTVVYGNSVFGTTCDVSRNITFMFQFDLQKGGMKFALIGQSLKNRVNHTLVCHKNYLYIMGGDNGDLSIDRLDLDKPAQSQWQTVGHLVQAVSGATATVLGNVIIIIGNVKQEGQDETSSLIQCFDPETMSTHLVVDALAKASEKRVFVKRWSDVYLLQEGGDFWLLQTTREKDRLNLNYRGRLWNSQVNLTSAIIYREELVVLAKPSTSQAAADGSQGQNLDQEEDKVPTRWETPQNELFKRVHILREDKCCLMTAVLPSA
ncbi:kelch repeat and BTB domain-containing protein 8 [Elysia marginata]|uniref:Kelch repeat and BTB domain-containing protein 8 n=1 Tax=Elysia marginata TaxID=1093978 RepID=A0AAV4JIK6_9GAST|nr:kelch repeat and BTB domain-containing protein 8 [Elysia marginata]